MIDKKLIFSTSGFVEIVGDFPNKNLNLFFDSRKFSELRNYNNKEELAFFPLKGERFNAHSYISDMIEKGCKVVFTEEKLSQYHHEKDTTYIVVKSTNDFLVALSKSIVDKWKSLDKREPGQREVVAITGSCGKTTQKEMLYHIVNSIYPNEVLCNYKNFNNIFGLCFTLLKLREKIRYLIVEIGTNGKGEIAHLSEVAKPDHGIITCIGPSHLEFLGTVDNVFIEKKSLFDWVDSRTKSKNPLFVVDGDDPYLNKLTHEKTVKFFSEEKNHADLNYQLNSGEAHIFNQVDKEQNTSFLFKPLHFIGDYNIKNALSVSLFASRFLNKSFENILDRLKEFKIKDNRSMWFEDSKGKKFYIDCYNANPLSMKVSLKGFCEYLKQQKISLVNAFFILGNMNELGDKAKVFHEELGTLAYDLGIVNVAFIGEQKDNFKKTFHRKCYLFANKSDFEGDWEKIYPQNKVFFVKGSRSLELETLVPGYKS